MPKVTRKRHRKPFWPKLIRTLGFGGRTMFYARATVTPYGNREYTLHPTKGWRCRQLPIGD